MLKNTIDLFFSIDLPMPQNTSDLYLELYNDVWCNNTNDWGSALTIDHFIPVTKFIYNKDILLALTTDFDLRIHTFGAHKYLPHSRSVQHFRHRSDNLVWRLALDNSQIGGQLSNPNVSLLYLLSSKKGTVSLNLTLRKVLKGMHFTSLYFFGL